MKCLTILMAILLTGNFATAQVNKITKLSINVSAEYLAYMELTSASQKPVIKHCVPAGCTTVSTDLNNLSVKVNQELTLRPGLYELSYGAGMPFRMNLAEGARYAIPANEVRFPELPGDIQAYFRLNLDQPAALAIAINSLDSDFYDYKLEPYGTALDGDYGVQNAKGKKYYELCRAIVSRNSLPQSVVSACKSALQAKVVTLALRKQIFNPTKVSQTELTTTSHEKVFEFSLQDCWDSGNTLKSKPAVLAYKAKHPELIWNGYCTFSKPVAAGAPQKFSALVLGDGQQGLIIPGNYILEYYNESGGKLSQPIEVKMSSGPIVLQPQ